MPTPSHGTERKVLLHGFPVWVQPSALFFITICCHPRGENQLCHPTISGKIFAAFTHYQRTNIWHVRLAVLMPDHLHALIAFAPDQRMKNTLRAWKRFLAVNHGIRWQGGFFDHRPRGVRELRKKTDYIRQNPVRAGLVQKAAQWPYKLEFRGREDSPSPALRPFDSEHGK